MDRTIMKPPYLCNGNAYTGKIASLYWNGRLACAAAANATTITTTKFMEDSD